MNGKANTTGAIHFFNLDIVRCVAVMMVVAYHGFSAYTGWFQKDAGLYAGRFFLNLNLGVDLFFLISGFLITYLLLKEKESSGSISIGKFYLRRTLRIWPLYYLVIALAPFIVGLADQPAPHYTGTIFFMNNFETIHYGGGTYPFVHFWTLSIEEQYYLLWPLVIAFVPLRHLPKLFGVVILAALSYRILAFYYGTDAFNDVNNNSLTRGDTIVFGSLLAYFHFRKPIAVRISRTIRFVLYVALIFGFFFITGFAPRNMAEFSFYKYFFLAGFLFWIINYLFNADAAGNFKKKNVLHYMGRISYGIYVFHNILIPIIINKLMVPMRTDNVWVFWTIYVGSSILLATLSYELFEKRILRLKERFEVVRTQR